LDLTSTDKFFRLSCPFIGRQGLEVFIGDLEPFLSAYFGLPAKDLRSAGDVWPALFGVVFGQRTVNNFLFRTGKGDHFLGKLFQCDLGGIAEVDRAGVVAGLAGSENPLDREVAVLVQIPGAHSSRS